MLFNKGFRLFHDSVDYMLLYCVLGQLVLTAKDISLLFSHSLCGAMNTAECHIPATAVAERASEGESAKCHDLSPECRQEAPYEKKVITLHTLPLSLPESDPI